MGRLEGLEEAKVEGDCGVKLSPKDISSPVATTPSVTQPLGSFTFPNEVIALANATPTKASTQAVAPNQTSNAEQTGKVPEPAQTRDKDKDKDKNKNKDKGDEKDQDKDEEKTNKEQRKTKAKAATKAKTKTMSGSHGSQSALRESSVKTQAAIKEGRTITGVRSKGATQRVKPHITPRLKQA